MYTYVYIYIYSMNIDMIINSSSTGIFVDIHIIMHICTARPTRG